MRMSDSLREEHEVIILMLEIIESLNRKLETGVEVDLGDLEEILNFITVFTDRCHHGKEEDILFVAMEEAGIPRKGGPIGVMLEEHEMGRLYVRSMKESIAQIKNGNRSYILKFIENSRNYAELLRNHIHKENNVLYPLAEMHISNEKQQKIIKDFEKLEIEKIGAGTHEKLHSLVHQLQNKYLKDS